MRIWLAIVATVGLVSGACAGSEAGFPTGTWTNTCERGTVKVLDFVDDGTLIGTFDNPAYGIDMDLTGTYSVTGERITFHSDSVCGTVTGVYSWETDDGDLLFTLIEDGCITPSTALRLSRYFGTSSGFWMNGQTRWDLYHTQQTEGDEVLRIRRHPRAMSGREISA